ncbi:hypothetical protein ONS96_000810 [Cadophora gregata f. sp. sojae]|nr:hypothetical protein ONS96_000810 [Cadophora gregata f. sp. sojae]
MASLLSTFSAYKAKILDSTKPKQTTGSSSPTVPIPDSDEVVSRYRPTIAERRRLHCPSRLRIQPVVGRLAGVEIGREREVSPVALSEAESELECEAESESDSGSFALDEYFGSEAEGGDLSPPVVYHQPSRRWGETGVGVGVGVGRRAAIVAPMVRHHSQAVVVEVCGEEEIGGLGFDEGGGDGEDESKYQVCNIDLVECRSPVSPSSSSSYSDAIFPLQITTAESTHHSSSFSCPSSLSSSFLAKDYENMEASVQVFATLDVESLISDPGPIFTDLNLDDADWCLEPHPMSNSCSCHWCEVARFPELRREKHDFGVWCRCLACLRFEARRTLLEMVEGSGGSEEVREVLVKWVERLLDGEGEGVEGEGDEWSEDGDEDEDEFDAGIEGVLSPYFEMDERSMVETEEEYSIECEVLFDAGIDWDLGGLDLHPGRFSALCSRLRRFWSGPPVSTPLLPLHEPK